MRVTVTAGPTQEALDPVRYLTNHSTGKMGYALARAAAMRGADVTLIHGETALPPVKFTTDVPVTTAQDLFEAVTGRFDTTDVLIMAAAVADYRPVTVASDKIKKKDGDLQRSVDGTQERGEHHHALHDRQGAHGRVPIDDGVKFQLKSISEIMDEAEYPGIRVSMSTTFDGVVTPLKIDISTGDAITPREVRYSFKLMLEDRSIDIWAYNLETVLAEKLETIITRTTTNTRMRDFYDIYILEQLHGTTLNPKILHDALLATAHKRGSEKYLNQAEEVFDEVENDSVMQKLWEAYRKKFSYASDLEWDVIMKAIRRLYVLCEKGISL